MLDPLYSQEGGIKRLQIPSTVSSLLVSGAGTVKYIVVSNHGGGTVVIVFYDGTSVTNGTVIGGIAVPIGNTFQEQPNAMHFMNGLFVSWVTGDVSECFLEYIPKLQNKRKP